MPTVAHRPRAVRDQIVDREVRRLELTQRAERQKDRALRTRPDQAAFVSAALNSR